MTTILLAEDERTVAQTLSTALGSAGYFVRSVPTGRMAVEAFRRERPDLVLLDVMMPDLDGYGACAAIRELDRDVPIVFLTACSADANHVRGLEVGADDYILKTTSDEVLLARIRKAIQRASRFKPASAPEAMTRTEAMVYRLLKSAPGRYFSYREISEAVCGDNYSIDEATLRSHMSHMRKKLPVGEAVDAKRGFGFRLF